MRRLRVVGCLLAVSLITACNCDEQRSPDAGASVDAGNPTADAGHHPIAVAGPAQQALPGMVVTLDGRGSSDPDGLALTFAWALRAQPDGGGAVLAGPTTAQPTFTPLRPGEYVAELRVSDGQKTSAPSTVVVTALNRPPVADAGPAQTVLQDDLVMLDGTGSQDPDGDALTYLWTLSVDAGLLTPTSARSSFVASIAGEVTARLVVNDGTTSSVPADVVVTVVHRNHPPVARASETAVLPIGTVTLDGTSSTDEDGDPLTFDWSILQGPDGGTATVVDPSASRTTLAVTTPGTYVLGLAVHDSDAGSQAQVSVSFALPCRSLLELGLHDGGAGFYPSQLGAPAGAPRPVLCEDFTSGDGGWTLLYKKSAGVVGNSYQLWLADGGLNAGDAGLLTRTRASVDYVTSFTTDGWPVVEQTRVELVTDGGVVRELAFDARGSTNLSWFAPEHRIAAPWTDLPTDAGWETPASSMLGSPTAGRFFSIQGTVSRAWYVNATWPGCPGDVGWMMVTHAAVCSWEGGSPSEIIYTPASTATNIQNTFIRADALLVFGR